MKILLLGFYIVFVPLGYSFELTRLLPTQMIYDKQKGEKAVDPQKPTTSPPVKVISDTLKNEKIKIPEGENFLKSHITAIKEFHNSLDKTVQEVTNKTPTSSQIAKIMFAISNLINNIDVISYPNHLDKVMDLVNELDDSESAYDIYELLCEVKNFLHIFSLSFIEETVKELPVKNEFDKKIESEWYKNGITTLTKCINILEKFVELEGCRKDIISLFPLVENTYKEISEIVSKMIASSSKIFFKETLEFINAMEDFKGVLKQIETNACLACLVSNKGITQAQEIISLAKGLYAYFFDLSNKLKEILEEVKVDEEEKESGNIQYYSGKFDGYIREILHDIFLCKYNKMFYKQMNDEVSKLLTLIQSLEEIEV